MTRINIREIEQAPSGQPNAAVSFDDGAEYSVLLQNPFTPEQEETLRWYFEDHLYFPFIDSIKADQAAKSITTYGEALFNQIFADRQLQTQYGKVIAAGPSRLQFEISGSPTFQTYHWEALKDPSLPRPFALESSFVRNTLAVAPLEAQAAPSPTLNILIVTARPRGNTDVGYRTLSRPLVEQVNNAAIPIRLELLRPGTYQALAAHLDAVRSAQGPGYYHIVHFDVNGNLLTSEDLEQAREKYPEIFRNRYGRGELGSYQGERGFLLFEQPGMGGVDLVEAGELAKLLTTYGIPAVILGANQSSRETGAKTSLAAYLMEAGVQLAVGMAYTISVNGVQRLMARVYEKVASGSDLESAVRQGRMELNNQKNRRGAYEQDVELEDWLLPVVYQNRPVRFELEEMTVDQANSYYTRLSSRFTFPQPEYGFVGRDLDILSIERRVLSPETEFAHNEIMVRGPSGVGKTALLRQLAGWWQETGFIDKVFYFSFEENSYTLQDILEGIARPLLRDASYYRDFEPLVPEARQAMLARRLRGKRQLIILDSLEMINWYKTKSGDFYPEEEKEKIRRFLNALSGGQTVVLIASCGEEEWLQSKNGGPIPEDCIYLLDQLDREASSVLADRILKRSGVGNYRGDPDLDRLVQLLGGYPVGMQIVLPNLREQKPAVLLQGFLTGQAWVDREIPDNAGVECRTQSILASVMYLYNQMSDAAQKLLLYMAPFRKAICTQPLNRYFVLLSEQPALKDIPFQQMWNALAEAQVMELIRLPGPGEVPNFIYLHPLLSYFLQLKLLADDNAEIDKAIHAAFCQYYREVGDQMGDLVRSENPDDQDWGKAVGLLEQENFTTALELALSTQDSISGIYDALDDIWEARQDYENGIRTGERIREQLDQYPPEKLAIIGIDRIVLLSDLGNRYHHMNQFKEAVDRYQAALDGLEKIQIDPELKLRNQAVIFQELGTIAQEQHQWKPAEDYYQKALSIAQQLNDSGMQANVYHNLGLVAYRRRKYSIADGYLKQALELLVQLNRLPQQVPLLQTMGVVAQEQQDWQRAFDCLQKALDLAQRFNNRYAQADIYHNLGVVAQGLEKWEDAYSFYRRSLEIKIENNDLSNMAITYNNLGLIARELGQVDQAVQYYNLAIRIYDQFNDRYEQASIYHQLGLIAQEGEDLPLAQDCYQRAAQIYLDFNDEDGLVNSLHNLGIALRAQKQWQNARPILLKALELIASQRNISMAKSCLANLALYQDEHPEDDLPAAVGAVLGMSAADGAALLDAIIKAETVEQIDADVRAALKWE